MKLITAFGLVSALLLLSVSTILVVKQNRTDDLTSEDSKCLEVTYAYNPRAFIPYVVQFINNCQERKIFEITYDDDSFYNTIVTSCLSRNEKYQGYISTPTTTIIQAYSSNC